MTKVAFGKTNSSVLLDLLRGTAALMVVLEHWRDFLFVDYPTIATHRLLYAPAYALCAAGHQAVVIFFVLSGYLVGGSVIRMSKHGSWSWPTYLVHRLTRLWIVLLPGLLLCLLWDMIGIRSGLAAGLYGGAGTNHMTPNVTVLLGLKTFLGNVFFLQTIRVHTFGSDGALWSLANEFWYYILFPLGLLALLPRIRLSVRTACLLLFALTVWFLPRGILVEFPIWLGGTLLCIVPVPALSKGVRWLTAGIYLPLPFWLARQKVVAFSDLTSDSLLAAATCLLLWVLLSAREEARLSLGHSIIRGLARFSYTLYVVHMPFLVLITALVVGDGRWYPKGAHIVEGIGVLGLTLAYAYGVATLSEFHTDACRRWLEQRLVGGRADGSDVATRS
jgi:peptidoglycan/LPS O-acetylase OafA/YrhL